MFRKEIEKFTTSLGFRSETDFESFLFLSYSLKLFSVIFVKKITYIFKETKRIIKKYGRF